MVRIVISEKKRTGNADNLIERKKSTAQSQALLLYDQHSIAYKQ